MHTFFINTSEDIAGLSKTVKQAYQGILFEKQTANKNLLILHDHEPIDKLGECAEEIAGMIDHEADIFEDIALVVYMESKIRMEDSSVSPQPQVVATETLLSLKAEAALVWKLCDMGKRPRELVFIFGESITRDQILEEDDVFRKELRKELWAGISLPSVSEVLDYIHTKINEHNEKTETKKTENDRNGEEKPEKTFPEITEQALFSMLTNNTTKEVTISGKDKRCYDGIVRNLAQMIEYQIDTASWEIDEEVIYNCLGAAVEAFTQTMLRDQIIGRYAVSVRYMYMPLETRDFHEKQRNACRLMMYLYGIAQEGNEEGFLNLQAQAGQIHRQRTENGPLHACIMPEVDYACMANLLNYKRLCCQGSDYLPAEPPDELNHRVENGDKLIDSDHPIPELVPRDLLREDGPVSRTRSMIADRLKRVLFSVASLRKAVDETMEDILEKDRNNSRKIQEYMNRVTAEYNRRKDDALKNIAFTEKLPNIEEGGSVNADRRIDDLQNMEDNVNRKLIDAEKELLREPPRLIQTKSVREQVAEVRAQTDYYLNSMKLHFLLLAAAILFVMAVMIPYVLTMKWVLRSIPGYLFIILTAAIALTSFAAGYILFLNVYRRRIKKIVRKLCIDFTLSQKHNSDCLNQYIDYLYKTIPQYYALSRYKDALHEYRERTKRRNEQIACHDRTRKEWANLIWVLMDNLDIKRMAEPLTDDNDTELIDPEKSLTENGEIYTLSARDVHQILRIGGVLNA